MFTDYNIDPEDSGEFIENHEFYDFDLSTENGITEIDKPKTFKGYRYFVRVGGGYRGFKKKVNARRYYNIP